MKLHIVTIVLDGMPWISKHLPEFNKLESLGIDWHWHIREGVAQPKHCTKWCKPIAPRYSVDGTSEYIREELWPHPRCDCVGKVSWEGKVSMFNHALERVTEPCILFQVDSDELWTAENIRLMVELFTTNSHAQRAYFWCNYFIGENILTTSIDGYGNRKGLEWLRAWRFEPGMRFDSHEPPVLGGNVGASLSRDLTRDVGAVFNHMAYATEAQVRLKEQYYGYRGAVENWRGLQRNKDWPISDVNRFLPWVERGVSADLASEKTLR